jgi:hypothetical protein
VFVEVSPRGSQFEAGSALAVHGSVRTRISPRIGVPVGLFVGERHLETVVTNEQGRFQADLWVDAPEGPLTITARAEGDAAGAYPATESRLEVMVQPARPVPLWWLVGATTLLVLFVWGLGRLRAMRGLEQQQPVEPSQENFGASIRPARAQGRRDRHRVTGRALDLRNDDPVPLAEVQLIHELKEGSCTLRADEFGRFTSPILPSGRARVRIAAPGYITTETDLELPHRGEWSSFVVRLESLRARALSPFRKLSLRVLPSTRAWGIWTTREAREWIQQKLPGDAADLTHLTLEVEKACYGPKPPNEVTVTAIEHSAETLEIRLAEASDGKKPGEPRPAR